MIGSLWTRVRKQPIIALYFELEIELKFYNLKARTQMHMEGLLWSHAFHDKHQTQEDALAIHVYNGKQSKLYSICWESSLG